LIDVVDEGIERLLGYACADDNSPQMPLCISVDIYSTNDDKGSTCVECNSTNG
jgi:hypothetical protein